MKTLRLAAIYNVLWGSFVIFFPNLFFDLLGMERPNYPELWQCIGMIVGVYGVGYWLAANDPIKHYPIVLVGFLGKVFGPIGFAQALLTNRLPLSFGINIIFNDLIWWIPFFNLLREKYKRDKTFLS
jgi:small multidrug resistance pump